MGTNNANGKWKGSYCVAVVGHRDPLRLPDGSVNESLRERFREILKDVLISPEAQFCLKNNLKIEVLTSLAPGADQLAAEIVRAEFPTKFEIRFVPPFPAKEYFDSQRQDLSDGIVNDERWEKDVLGRSVKSEEPLSKEVPRRNVYPKSGTSKKDEIKKREARLYRECAQWMVDRCDLLVAFWDGVDHHEKIGGTADTIHYARSRACYVARGNSQVDIKVIVTPREQNPFPVGLPYSVRDVAAWSEKMDGRRNFLEHLAPGVLLKKGFEWVWFWAIMLGLGILVTGTLGQCSYVDSELGPGPVGFVYSVFRTIAMLGFEGFGGPPRNSLLVCAHGLTILLALLGIGAAIWSFAWNWAGIRWFTPKPVILVGAGRKGKRLISRILERGKYQAKKDRNQIIVVDQKFDAGHRKWLHSKGVRTVEGDATDERTLELARIWKAERVVVMCGEDATNMQVCSLIVRLAQRPDSSAAAPSQPPAGANQSSPGGGTHGEDPVHCFVGLSDPELFSVVEHSVSDPARIQLHLLNVQSVTVRELFESYPIDRFEASPDASVAHVVVMGWTLMSREIVKQAILTGVFEPEKKLKLTVLAHDQKAAAKEFVKSYAAAYEKPKEISDDSEETLEIRPKLKWADTESILPIVRFARLPAENAGFHSNCHLESLLFPEGDSTDRQVITVYSAVDEGAESVGFGSTVAGTLARLRRDRKTDIQLFVYNKARDAEYVDEITHGMSRSAEGLPVIVFEDFMGNFTPENIQGKRVEELAMLIHWVYDQGTSDLDQTAKDACGFDFQNRADREVLHKLWHEAKEPFKASSRRAAAHVAVKLRIWNRLSPGANAETGLSEVEHRRWCADQFLAGMQPLADCGKTKWGWERYRDSDPDAVKRVQGWIREKSEKESWRSQQKHIYLLPLEEIGNMFQAFGFSDAAKLTQDVKDKDLSQVKFVLAYGSKMKVWSPPQGASSGGAQSGKGTNSSKTPTTQNQPHMKTLSHLPVFRVFVSSTFGEFQGQRDKLQEGAFRELAKFCEKNGTRFQAIDLRWGVTEEAGRAHNTIELCKEEIRRCKDMTPKPNFLVLVGKDYGWIPLPAVIPEDELKDHLRENPSGIVSRWYKLDKNAVPPVYVLQRRHGDFLKDSEWELEEKKIREALLKSLPADEERRMKYLYSATHQEIHESFLSKDAKEIARDHAIAFLTDAPDNAIIETKALREELKKKLPAERVLVLDPDLEKFDEDVYQALLKIIEAEIKTISSEPAQDQERKRHEKFARRKVLGIDDRLEESDEAQMSDLSWASKGFVGRDVEVGKILEYCSKEDAGVPLVVFGKSGAGKTSLLARCYLEQIKGNEQGEQNIAVFIGATASSSNIVSVLRFLLGELEGEPLPDNEQVSVKDLGERFEMAINKAAANRKVIIFIDSVDQLDPAGQSGLLTWLPAKLPRDARLVVSVLEETKEKNAGPKEGAADPKEGTAYSSIRKFEGAEFLEIKELEASTAQQALKFWLEVVDRKLEPPQMEEVLEHFENDKRPIFLRLLFEQARKWSSDVERTEIASLIAKDTESSIRKLFEELERPENHGAGIVKPVLTWLAASRGGLAEGEILELLANNPEFRQEVKTHAERYKIVAPEDGSIPVVLLSRLHLDLKTFLSSRASDGAFIVTFYHRLFREVASQFTRMDDQRELAEYFGRQPDFLDGVVNQRKLTEYIFQLEACQMNREAIRALSKSEQLEAFDNAGRLPEYLMHVCSNLVAIGDGSGAGVLRLNLARNIIRFCIKRNSLKEALDAMSLVANHVTFLPHAGFPKTLAEVGSNIGELRSLFGSAAPDWLSIVARAYQEKKADGLRRSYELDKAKSEYENLLDYLNSLPVKNRELQTLHGNAEYGMAYVCWLQNDLGGDGKHLRLSEVVCEQAGDKVGAVFARETWALHMYHGGNMYGGDKLSAEEALKIINESREGLEKMDDIRSQRWVMTCAVHCLGIYFEMGSGKATDARKELGKIDSDPWIKYFREYLENDGKRFKGQVLALEGKFDEALAEYEGYFELVEKKKQNLKKTESAARVYYEYGKIYHMAGNPQAGDAQYREAVKLPDTPGNKIWIDRAQKELSKAGGAN
jgi:voltage-gated potassium channel Kch/tetratricopeptide (TPR) repeat protein